MGVRPDDRSWRDARFDMVFWLVGAGWVAAMGVVRLATGHDGWSGAVGQLIPVGAMLVAAERTRRLIHRRRRAAAATPPPDGGGG